MHQPFARWVTMVVAILSLAERRADGQQGGPIRRATPVEWQSQLRQASRAPRPTQDFPTEPNESHHLVGLTTESTPRLIIQAPHIRPGRPSAEMALWLADLDGSHPLLLADESGRAFFQVEPAPGSGRVSYIAAEPARPDDAQPFRGATLRVAEPGVPTRTIATGGVQAPGWSPDGRTLFFLKAVASGWQAFKSEHGAEPIPASGVIFNQTGEPLEPPARLSPNGVRVVGFRRVDNGRERLTEVDLSSGGVRDLSGSGPASRIDWSPDSAWIYLQTSYVVRGPRIYVDHAVCLANRRTAHLNNRLDLLTQPAMGDYIHITAAGWLPGPGHRLLLLARHQLGQGDTVAKLPGVPREARWLVRDLDAKTSTEIDGLPLPPSRQRDPVISSRLHISSDGRYVLGLGILSILDRPL